VVVIQGDLVPVTYTANDDGAGQVTIFADADGSLATPGDQVPLLGPIAHPGGANANAMLNTAGLIAGSWTLVLRIDDGVNAAVTALLTPKLVVFTGVAGVRHNAGGQTRNHYGISGSYIIFSVGEQEDTALGTNKNGDGDMLDGVVTVLHTTTGIRADGNVAFDIAPAGAAGVPVIHKANTSGSFVWTVPEAQQGAINADMDLTDRGLAFITPINAVTPFLNPYTGPQAIAYFGDVCVFPIAEADQAADLTMPPNAILTDIHWGIADPLNLPLTTGIAEMGVWATYPGVAGSLAFPVDTNAVAAYLTPEGFAGAAPDHNGDTDVADTMIVLTDLLSAPGGVIPPPNLAGPSGTPRAVDPAAAFDVSNDTSAATVAYVISETADGNTDHNGNVATTDYVPAVYSFDTETILNATGPAAINCGPAMGTMIFDGDRVFFTVLEGALGNNDGDGTDTQILTYADETGGWVATAALNMTNVPNAGALTGLALDGNLGIAHLAPGWLAVVVAEGANANKDFNGNGLIDSAYLLIDMTTSPPTVHSPAPTGGSTNLGIIPSASGGTGGNIPMTGVADASGVVVRLAEGVNGILNGDGDNTDVLLAYVSFASPGTATVLDAGGDSAAIGGSRILITANEAYTGVDYDMIGGAFTFALRAYDLSGNVVLAGKPCAKESIPATDDGSIWIYLRDEVFELADRNGDGDQADLILGIWTP
jgi:hypothetical protein